MFTIRKTVSTEFVDSNDGTRQYIGGMWALINRDGNIARDEDGWAIVFNLKRSAQKEADCKNAKRCPRCGMVQETPGARHEYNDTERQGNSRNLRVTRHTDSGRLRPPCCRTRGARRRLTMNHELWQALMDLLNQMFPTQSLNIAAEAAAEMREGMYHIPERLRDTQEAIWIQRVIDALKGWTA